MGFRVFGFEPLMEPFRPKLPSPDKAMVLAESRISLPRSSLPTCLKASGQTIAGSYLLTYLLSYLYICIYVSMYV